MDTIRNNSWVFLLRVIVFYFVFCTKLHRTTAADTISFGDSLTGNQIIISRNYRFVLGYFKPGTTTSQNYYIGIWYKKVSVQTVVWVANRDAPITDPSSSKLILLHGNLVLLDNSSKTPIWSTNLASNTLNTPQVVLGDDGNLVLRDGSNRNVVYWQSFDYPTDTLLPGAKLWFNKETSQSQKLVSWRSPEGPAKGLYTLVSGPSQSVAILWKNVKEIWNSGEWNEESKSFPSIPEMMKLKPFFNYNLNENYFTYSVNTNSTLITRLVIDFTGQIKQLTWSDRTENWNLVWVQPPEFCDVYGICGPFGDCNVNTQKCECLRGFVPTSSENWSLQDSSGGCSRSVPFHCGSNVTFTQISTSHSILPDKPQLYTEYDSVEECQSACKVKCSCNAYSFNVRCLLWNGDVINFNNTRPSHDTPSLFYLKLAATQKPKMSLRVLLIIVVPTVITVLSITTILCFCIIKRRRKIDDIVEIQSSESLEFKFSTINAATSNFSDDNKLGRGGFGTVYKGTLTDGQEIAVKRLSENSCQGEEEFKNEVALLIKLQHKNLVRLLGFCLEGDEKLLVYEFMKHGSLDQFLFGPVKRAHLDWGMRHMIVEGIAKGLLYLHEDSRLNIIHRDPKASNVLLGADMVPKIADFGMARIFKVNQNQDCTKRICGTFGYMAPEYAMFGKFSVKSDIFSFGVLILEILCGRKSNSFGKDEDAESILTYARKFWNEGKPIELLDPTLRENYSANEVMSYIQIALSCVQQDAAERPTMAEIVDILNNDYSGTLAAPLQPPAFSLRNRSKTEASVSSQDSNSVSVNEVSMTELYPR
ncbi:hypothetical protein C5167_007656 [Papaver somniferum]|uniref:G-type lectin S-receptor-like serine/threonine-protein kinase RKS1 n=1 Tax=Papaver somniferum TaxID=3469 RepID=UPI000E70219E|nr:G-type lectin S-receptor-like serine/threonine-protein kinase RKS1 [Papaver somniferum]RZC93617.1 hypothetical protein C5167_007656 [Papaver somniferum]